MFKRASRLAAIAMAIAAAGCAGSDGSQGPQGPQGVQGVPGTPGNPGAPGQDLTATAQPESCTVCHRTSGSEHQSIYSQYTDASKLSASIVDVQSVSSVTTVTFSVTYNGHAATSAEFAGFAQKRFGAVTYDSATDKFTNNTVNFNAPYYAGVDGSFAVTGTTLAIAPEAGNAFVYGYLAANVLPTEGMTLYSDVTNFARGYGNVGTYASAANVSGCVRCHGSPYMKHGYRAAAVTGLTDFVACKSCHYDNRNGSDQDWTRLVDDPLSFATSAINTTQKAMYAYKASVMNDVHMSHAMEFAYPQSMANCTTCHEGKTAQIFADANFNIATCRSCHPVTGPANPGDADKARAPALKGLMQAKTTAHNGWINQLYANGTIPGTVVCSNCHDGVANSGNPTFAEMHNGGTIKAIADSAGARTASIFTVTVDSAVQTANTVRVTFSATKGAAAAELDPTTVGSIVPTILVGIYGYDTKDFIVDPHGRDAANNRNLEFVWGGTHPRFKNPSYAAGTWSIDVGLGDFAAQLATSKRFEVAVIPTVKAPDGTILAVNAPSKTFASGAGTLAALPANTIADATKCNKCHEALGSTFHSPDRGGNVTVCRLCHNTRSGGGHLEMQSRSIDSYVHAIHKFQVFDIASIDPANPVSAMRYTHHIESGYPNFTIFNCESCHAAGKYEAPANDKSLPGVLSAAANIAVRGSWTAPGAALKPVASNIGTIPSMVTGPASRACGSCHRAGKINENDAAGLNAFNGHADAMGYMLTSGTGTLDAAITKVMSFFR